MPRVIDLADEAACSLSECAEMLGDHGFDPLNEESLAHGAKWLRRLGNNDSFLGDLLIENLRQRHRTEDSGGAYGPQSIVLSAHRGNCFLRANVWPGKDDAMLSASGNATFLYDMAHDHNFHFLTLGYFGPGYWSDYYEYDYGAVEGYAGEPVALVPKGRQRLDSGKLMLYRAHLDVHRQLPADSLSVSLNVMHTDPAMGLHDQYKFDVDAGTIGGIVNSGSTEAFLRIAVAMGGEEALDMAERFAGSHPSDRVRLTAFGALALAQTDDAARDGVWARAEASGSRMVAMEAKTRRMELVG